MGKLVPFDFRVGGQVSVIVADGSVDFTQYLRGFDLTLLPPESVAYISQFLTDGGWRGRLAMGAG